MNVILQSSTYSVDGTSLTDSRCRQFLILKSFVDEYPGLTYKELQNLAEQNKIFGEAKADSLIRTIAPLLQKMGLADYSTSIPFHFTNLGKAFLNVCESIFMLNESDLDDIRRTKINDQILKVRKEIIRQGLWIMYNNAECSNHKVWHLIYLLFHLGTVSPKQYWLYLYEVLEKETGKEEALNIVKDIDEDNIEFRYINNGQEMPLPRNSYSYPVSLLDEAGLIKNINANLITLADTDSKQYLERFIV